MIDWSNVFTNLSVDDMWSCFCSRFLDLLDKYVPTSVSSRRNLEPPWMTKLVFSRKCKAWFKYRITHLHSDYLEYAKLRNDATATVRNAKQ